MEVQQLPLLPNTMLPKVQLAAWQIKGHGKALFKTKSLVMEIKINWQRAEPYHWIGTTENQTYELWVEQTNWPFPGRWTWKVFEDEYKVLASMWEEKTAFATIEEAMEMATEALNDYLLQFINAI